MKLIRLATVTAVLAAALAACSSPHPTANKPPQVIPPAPLGQTATASVTPTATATPTATSTLASTTIDPCQLVTAQEASTLAGVSYGPGKLEVDSVASRRCIYGGQTRHVFEVIFVQGTSAAQADAYAATLRAEAEQKISAEVALTKITGIGDDAESLQGNKSGVGMSGLYVVKGASGFGLVDVALGQAASIAALTTQAQTVLGRLP